MRRVAGRYLNASTLPYWLNYERRPYWDYLRNLSGTIKRIGDSLFPPPNKPKPLSAAEWEKQQAELKKKAQNLPTHDRTHFLPPFWSIRDPFAFGHALNARGDERTYSPLFGVYGHLNADPFLLISGDFRTVYFKTPQKEVFFPMQGELATSLHPVEHFTLAVSGGVLGSPQARQIPVEKRTYVRQAILMLHELPYQSYVKAGAFIPGFGLRLEDHTAYVNRFFERNMSRRNITVYGAEVGLAPNYPYFSASVFTNMGNEFHETAGYGAAANLGWRDLLFGGGLSFMQKKRPNSFGGDFQGISVDFYLNLGRIWFTNPIVFMGELIWGERRDSLGFRQSFGHFFELSYLILNGLNLKVNHHFYDPSFAQRNTETGRYGAGFDFTPFPFIRFTVEYQWVWLLPETGRWRQGNLINPADMAFTNQLLWVSHVYF
ncbi:MAG: hypothetical protein NZM25_05005 [Leptospiraceae bacterium]|nr:hypothetical protein [Leptospiraceae bacterium]MDW8305632.1 hypothetical protein [Leptospiraceae bacterium]